MGDYSVLCDTFNIFIHPDHPDPGCLDLRQRRNMSHFFIFQIKKKNPHLCNVIS